MTLNQIVRLIKNFATNHAQINTFGQGDIAEISASNDVKYPLFWLVLPNVTYQTGAMQYPFRIILADLIDQEKGIELEVQSDMLQVAQDFIGEFRDNQEYDLSIDGDVNINFFTDRLTDLVAGVDFTANVMDFFPLNRCVVPEK